jgi:hypothetical protein
MIVLISLALDCLTRGRFYFHPKTVSSLKRAKKFESGVPFKFIKVNPTLLRYYSRKFMALVLLQVL